MERHTRLSPQLVLGLCAIGFGILLTLDNLHIMRYRMMSGDSGRPSLSWSASCRCSGRGAHPVWAAGVILAGAGSLLLLGNLHYIRFSLRGVTGP